MQSLCGSLIRRQNLNGSHFKSILAYLTTCETNSHRRTLSKSDSSAPRTSYGFQMEKTLLNGSGRGCELNLSRWAAMGTNFPSRSMTTMGNSESSQENLSAPNADVPSRIKFKRPDKTARHIMQILDKEAVEEVRSQREIPDIRPGYTVQLKVEVPENKRRVSTIVGTVIARRNAGLNTTFRLRRTVAGVGVESLFPLYSPNIKEIKVVDNRKKVRRAKLYYLRDRMNASKKR